MPDISSSQNASDYPLPLDTAPMEAATAAELPAGPGWQYEPKWDGFRCLVFKAGDAVELRAKSGKPLGRYFPEVVRYFQELSAERFVIDGELVIEVDERLSFNVLQARLHPAESRILKLSRETPGRFVLFDMLATPDGEVLLDRPLSERRRALERFARISAKARPITLSPASTSRDEASRWLSDAGHDGMDGVVAKRLDDAYLPGERIMIMIKIKRLRTADCVVGGFRYRSNKPGVGSLLLGLCNDEGKLDHVGFTSTISNEERPELTRRLEAIREPPGFTGKAPGGPSRWSTERSGEWEPVRPELVVEVRFDHVTGRRFRHGTKLIRWRPDKRPDQCTFAQIEPPAMPR